MEEKCESYQVLMSGELDGELEPADRQTLQAHLDECAACRDEFEQMRQLVTATSQLCVEPPPEEVWDTFLDGVYNRLERRAGWWVFIVGLVVLGVTGVYLFLTEPWGTAFMKVACAAPVIGLAILFISVLRQRLSDAKTDRYSKEIKR